MKPLQNGEITLPFTDVGYHAPVNANMSFNVIHENKILVKISIIYSNKLVVFNDIHVTILPDSADYYVLLLFVLD